MKDQEQKRINNCIEFSVDDVLKCLFWLQDNDAESIFCSSTFMFAKKMWEQYEIPTTFNMFLQNKKGRKIEEVSSKWKQEFLNHSKFIKFSFHAKDSMTNYSEANFYEVDQHYKYFLSQAQRIWGNVKGDVRMHCFAGNTDAVNALKENGVKVLYTSDDDRICYDLVSPLKEGQIEKDGMIYRKSDFRLENKSKEDIEMFVTKKPQNRYVIFTHEKYLREEETFAKMKSLVKAINNNK